MARRGHSRFIRPAPRTKMWVGHGVGNDTVVASTLTLLGSLSASVLLLRPFTILRTHLEVYYRSDQITATETIFGTLADLVVTETAAALGVTALPNPSPLTGDPEQDWYLYQNVESQFNFASGVGFQGDSMGVHYGIDSKAMRKVGPNDDVVLLFDQEAAVGAEVTTMGRQLIQLH